MSLTPEQQERINKAKKEGKELDEEILRIVNETIEAREKEAKTVKGLAEKYAELARDAKMSVITNDQIEMQNQYFKIKEALRDASVALNRAEEEGNDKQVSLMRRNLAMLNEQATQFEKMGVVAKETSKSVQKFAEEADSAFSDLASKSFMFLDSSKGFAGSMFSFATAMKTTENPMAEMLSSFRKHFNLTTLANSMIAKFTESTIDMVRAFDEASAGFAAATGTGDEFAGTMLEMRQEGNALGVTFENSSKALQSLVENHVGFLNASKTAQKEMATQVALMDRIGISTDTSAEMLNVFTINMGKSQGAAIQMTKSLVNMGSVLGNSQKFLQGFQESLQSLAVYGEDAVDVFSNLAAAARAAGVEVSTLTGIADRFDTFSNAAEAVGKLNALLGSQLSSTEMLLMTEDQRIETLIQQVQISGESFAQMDRFKQKAIAAAAGISDMNEAQRIFGMNMKEYKGYQKQMEAQARTQENFNKAIESTIPLQEKFKQFMAEFAIFVQPLTDMAAYTLGVMTDTMASLGDGTKKLILFGSVIGIAVTAFSGLGAALPLVGAAAGTVATGVGAITAAAAAGGPAMVGLGTAAGGAAVGMGAFSLPLLGIAAAISGVVLSLGYLVSQFVELAKVGPQTVGIMTSFAGALTALTAAGSIGIFGAGGIFLSMQALTSSLTEVKEIIGNETSAISNALENLALIATGTSAKAMGGATANIATELRGAVEALTTTKIDIKLSIDDGKLYDIMKGAVADVISNDNTTRQQIVTLARGA